MTFCGVAHFAYISATLKLHNFLENEDKTINYQNSQNQNIYQYFNFRNLVSSVCVCIYIYIYRLRVLFLQYKLKCSKNIEEHVTILVSRSAHILCLYRPVAGGHFGPSFSGGLGALPLGAFFFFGFQI